MEIKVLILISVLVLNVNSQIDGLGQANTCAKSGLGDTLPNKKETCWGDLSDPANNCCYVSAKSNGVDISICSAIPKGANLGDITEQIKKFGLESTIECGAQFTKLGLFSMMIYGLMMTIF